jgi:hypothetical protein
VRALSFHSTNSITEHWDPDGRDAEDYKEAKEILLGTEGAAALVSDEQMENFLQAALNTGDIWVESFIKN